jgi:hypothetical protein
MDDQKKRVCVIRSNEHDHTHLLDCLLLKKVEVIDVHVVEKINIRYISTEGGLLCHLNGVSLIDLDFIFFLNLPYKQLANLAFTRLEHYKQQEIYQALLAAIAQVSKPILINKGHMFAWNRLLLEPSRQVRMLSKLGWQTISTGSHFYFEPDSIIEVRHPDPKSFGSKTSSVLITRKNLWSIPDNLSLSDNTLKLIRKTQEHMESIGLDYSTLTLISDGPDTFACGCYPFIPRSLDAANLDYFVSEILAL